MRFERDKTKSQANKKKHGISFEEGSSVFYDDNALVFDDPDHSGDEDRFLLLGLSSELRVLVVVRCNREDDEVIRIISAREATPSERNVYGSEGADP